MKKVGNLLMGVGITGFILASCGYDSNMIVCGIIAAIGIVVCYAGYRIGNAYEK